VRSVQYSLFGRAQAGHPATINRVTGIPWAQLVPDVIGAGGVLVAGVAVWKAGQAATQSNAVAARALTVNEGLAIIEAQGLAASQAVAAIEGGRRHTERTPRFSADLAMWGTGMTDLRLNVWLDSTEAVSRLRVVVREARNNDGPIGFKRGLRGVPNELPRDLELEGILPAWSTDSLSPIAEWPDRLAPGNAAVFLMQLRQWSEMSDGSAGIRFKVLAWPDSEPDGESWELPLPVGIRNDALRFLLDQHTSA